MNNTWIGLYEYDVHYYFMYYSCCIIHNNACIVHYLFRTTQNVQCCILSWYSSCWKFKLTYSAWNSKCQSKRSMAPARTRSSWARGPRSILLENEKQRFSGHNSDTKPELWTKCQVTCIEMTIWTSSSSWIERAMRSSLAGWQVEILQNWYVILVDA